MKRLQAIWGDPYLLTSPSAAQILRKLTRENAFYFFTSVGNYTGTNAASLEEFVNKVREVDVKCLEFHLYRGDFEKWIADVLKDGELAEEIKGLKSLKLAGNSLRNQLYFIVLKRFKRLEKELLHRFSH